MTAASGTFKITLPTITVPISANPLPGSGGGGGGGAAGGAIMPFIQVVTSLDIIPNKTAEQVLTYTPPLPPPPPSTQKLKQFYLISWNTAFPVQRPRSFKLEYTLGSAATFTLSYKQTITNPASFSALRLVFNILINGMKKTVTNKTVALQAGVFVSPAISIGNVLLNDILTIKLITLQGLQGTKWRTFASLFNKTYKFI